MHIIFETSIHVDYIIKSSAVNITVFYTYYITDTCKMICEMMLFETLYILFTICLTEFVYLKTSYLYKLMANNGHHVVDKWKTEAKYEGAYRLL